MVKLWTLAAVAASLASFQCVQALNLGEVDPQTLGDRKKGTLVVEYFMPNCKRCHDFGKLMVSLSSMMRTYSTYIL
ncbi:hypothetical protein BDF20DRAFT_551459 [Mycotypha africana]|uniref:uncharacterized protein n=1 Tax=Mycotypha africana TaxID=64632 RepID=UPI00230016A5|nr:uncharacterized protein BDF20DRAFT_551459 [Mycotypha africana]KAI8977209.1 hypothetical protein BDF20DRAFT_551459 [Mycotypha africana]